MKRWWRVGERWWRSLEEGSFLLSEPVGSAGTSGAPKEGMTVNRDQGEEGGRPPSPGPPEGGLPQAGGAGDTVGAGGGAGEGGLAPPEQEVVAPPVPRSDQEAIDSFPTQKLTKLDELISNPRYI